MSNITGHQRTCCVPQSLKSGTSARHMSARIHPRGGERRESLGSRAHYIQVRDSFISIPGPVKATQLWTALTHTEAPGPLSGLPAGLFTVLRFFTHENEDSVFTADSLGYGSAV